MGTDKTDTSNTTMPTEMHGQEPRSSAPLVAVMQAPQSSVIVMKKRSPDSKKKKGKGQKSQADLRYGWGRFTPNCLQCLHKPPFLLICLSVLLIVQGFIVNGVIPASVTHLERRFHFGSAEIGALSSVYDAGVVIVLLPISHYASHGHKGRWVVAGAVITGVASIICTLPHFFAEPYKYGAQESEQICVVHNETSSLLTSSLQGPNADCAPSSTNMLKWKITFYIGEFLLGIGSSPLFTIAVAYMDENVSQHMSSTYIGIYTANVIIGPCLGYGAAAYLSGIYGYPTVDLNTLPMKDPSDQRWYGAWWIGVLGAGALSFLVAIPLFGFARELPGTAKLREKDIDEAHHHGTASLTVSASMADWGTFTRRLKVIVRNPTYIGLIVEQWATTFIAGGFALFSTKYLETLFSMTTKVASMAAAATAIPSALIGTVIGTFLQRRLQLKCTGNIVLSIVSTSIATASWLVFFVVCPTRPFAGVTSFLGNATVSYRNSRLTEPLCNAHCTHSCSLSRFEPHCLQSERVSFFSTCHAGCDAQMNCSCAFGQNVTEQLCDSLCTEKQYMPFLIGLALLVLFVYLKKNPVQQAILRCVPFNLRTFALALGWIPIRLLGSVPASPMIGWIFNSACAVWQEKCGENEVCVLYDNEKLASHLQLAGVIGFAVAYVALVVAWKLYKPPPAGEPSPGKSDHSILEEALRSSWKDPVVEP